MSAGPLGLGLDAMQPGFRQAQLIAALDRRLRSVEGQRAKGPQTGYDEETGLGTTTAASPGIEVGPQVTVDVQDGQFLSVFATADLSSNTGTVTPAILLRGLPRWGDVKILEGSAGVTAVTWAVVSQSNVGVAINALNPLAVSGGSWQVYPTHLAGLGSFTPGEHTISMWLYRAAGANTAQVGTRRLCVEVR